MKKTADRTIRGADLFCGSGGSSTGLVDACLELGRPVDLVAVNHWPTAVETHRSNYPWATHFCQDIRAVDPRVAVPGGRLDILLAGAPCPHFSLARGGRPMDDHERSTPREILRWLRDLDVKNVLIENVKEFQTWGPLTQAGFPVRAKMGDYYRDFIGQMERLGYQVEARVLNAADYGAATTRKRLFIMATKGRLPSWPEPSHTKDTWRPARDVIDWSIPGRSIFGRKKPLSEKTIRRIAVGIERYCGELAKPFLVMLYGTGKTRSIDIPLPTVTSGGGRGGGHIALCEFVLQQQSGGVARPVSRPVPTIAASGAQMLVDACLVQVNHGGGDAGRIHSVREPLRTLASKNGFGLASFLVKYYGTGIAKSVLEPMSTVTAKDRMGLVDVELEAGGPVHNGNGNGNGSGSRRYEMDIRLRMLEPHELAAAMSFPHGYVFTGNRADKVRQIGNAWDVSLGRALCRKMLEAA